MKTFLIYTGTVMAALAASACCWIPALLAGGAAGSLGISAVLAPWRPYLLALTGLYLLSGFWMVYRKPKASCCDSDGCASADATRPRKVNIALMWVIAVFAIAMAAYPSIIAAFTSYDDGSNVAAAAPGTSILVFKVEGMDCEACAVLIKREVEKVPGVRSASIDFKKKQLVVAIEYSNLDPAPILTAVKRVGFIASKEENKQSE